MQTILLLSKGRLHAYGEVLRTALPACPSLYPGTPLQDVRQLDEAEEGEELISEAGSRRVLDPEWVADGALATSSHEAPGYEDGGDEYDVRLDTFDDDFDEVCVSGTGCAALGSFHIRPSLQVCMCPCWFDKA